MSAPDPGAVAVGDQPSFARLHGLACWHCGAVSAPLRPAGEVTLDGEARSWPVVACPAHWGQVVL